MNEREEDEAAWKKMFELPDEATEEDVWIGFSILCFAVVIIALLIYSFR